MNTLNDIGTQRVDKHPESERSSETTHTPMSILYTNKNGRFVPKDETGRKAVGLYSDMTAETTSLVLSKNKKLLSRVSEDGQDTAVPQVSCVNA